ncbi:MAG: prepilin-type N-terminal cleavage/methylation domain-containing protein [Planctomycetes bacterium]|nr:prepilin-type N-terminal cleavage/methylation domain-containing protein [Planctomycetota bacterium]
MRVSVRDDGEAIRRRGAFTLIELMVAMIIIAILIALLLPAVNSVIRRTRVARVVTEIKDLEAALANFKAKYGVYPPSRITLYPPGSNWSTRSKALIRRIWPQFDFTTSGGAVWLTAPVTLNGAQCLVFFLGGVTQDGAVTGFSKNPARPFALGGTREGPFFEFDTRRLTSSAPGNSRFPVYLDPLPSQTRPYLYASSYDGNGYQSADLANLMAGVYYEPGEDKNGNNQLDAGEDANSNGRLDFGPAFKPRSFQIISPGFDHQYGIGGSLDVTDAEAFLQQAGRTTELDNITNFTDGLLGQ